MENLEPDHPAFEYPRREPTSDADLEPGSTDPPPRGGIDGLGFSIPELRSLAVGCGLLFLSFVCIGSMAFLPRPEADFSTLTEAAPHPEASAPENGLGQAVSAEDLMKKAPGVMTLIGLLIWGSILGLFAISISWLISPGLRERLQLGRVAPRALPEVWVIDFLVGLAIWTASISLSTYLLIQITPEAWWQYNPLRKWWDAQDNAGHIMTVVAQFAAYGVAMIALLFLVRVRAGKPGLAGLWPFWRNESCEKEMSILADIGQALFAYLLLLSPLWFSNVLNIKLLEALGYPLDENPLVQIFFQESRGWAMLVIVFLVTVGAAIAEEFIFRGVLYSLLRRYLNRWPSAIIASIIFSSIHGVSTNVLSLFLLGLLFTWMYERTGRLLAPMVLHAANNGLTMLILFLSA